MLEAAESVCAGDMISDWEVVDLLTSLVEKSLVVYDEQTGRYRLLETIRQYSRELLGESREGQEVRQRHQSYFLRLAETAAPRLQGAEQAEWLKRLWAEHGNLREALAYCHEKPETAEASLRLAAALWRFWQLHGYLSEGREQLEVALAQEGAAGRTLLRANALNNLGNLARSQGNVVAARDFFEESLAIFQALADDSKIAAVLANLGNVATDTGDYGTARQHLEKSLTIRQQIGNVWDVANTLLSLGNIAYYQGDYAQAGRLWAESLAQFQQTGDQEKVALVLGNQGALAQETGRLEQARLLHEKSLSTYRNLGYKASMTLPLQNLAEIACLSGNYGLAQKNYEQSLGIAREIGDRLRVGSILVSMSSIAMLTEDLVSARSLLQEGLPILQQVGDRRELARGAELLGYLMVAQGRSEQAAQLLAAANALRAAIGGSHAAG